MSRQCFAVIVMAMVLGVWGVAAADEPDAAPALPAGLEPHMRTVQGGEIDWADGTIIGFVLGPMPTESDNEQWRGLMQLYDRYTAHE